jgi:hypothetical protein
MTGNKIVLNAYEIESHDDSCWEVYEDTNIVGPDVYTNDEFGEWLNDPYTRENYDVRVFTLDAYYEALAGEYNVD